MCPIPDGALELDPSVLLYDDETVTDAVLALRDAEGSDRWFLALELEAGGYATARFSKLMTELQAQGKAFLDRPLGELVGSLLTQVSVIVDQDQADYRQAIDLIHASEGGVGVVVREGEFQGVLYVGGLGGPSGGSLRGGPFRSELVSLAGQYIEIPDQGTLSRRRLEARKRGKPSGKP